MEANHPQVPVAMFMVECFKRDKGLQISTKQKLLAVEERLRKKRHLYSSKHALSYNCMCWLHGLHLTYSMTCALYILYIFWDANVSF